MDVGQAELTRLSTPILQEFLAATAAEAPARPAMPDIPELPASMAGHGLFDLLNDTIVRTLALCELPRFKASRCTAALSVLYVANKDVFETLRRRVETAGGTLYDLKIKLAAKALEDQVQRAKHDGWVYGAKGLPEPDNPDNVTAALAIIGAEVRWNAWLNRAEIRGHEWPAWAAIDDVVISKLKMRFLRTGTRFRVTNDFLCECLLALAHDNQFDPVVDRIKALKWDGSPRLDGWLSHTCSVPNDPYHRAVGRSVIGGMVKRALNPGAKHDEAMVLIGRHGPAKSEICRILAMRDEWHTDFVLFKDFPRNSYRQLAGKLVVELTDLDRALKKQLLQIKTLINCQSDSVTLRRRTFATDLPRRCIFVGTSSKDNWLVDMSGNRRLLPVRVLVAKINTGWLRDNIGQLIAEAAHLHRKGCDFTLPAELWDVAAERTVSEMELHLTKWFAPTPYAEASYITWPELVALSDARGWPSHRRNAVMRKLGFRLDRPYIDGFQAKVWVRGPRPKRYADAVRYVVIANGYDGRHGIAIRTPSGKKIATQPVSPRELECAAIS